MDDDKEVPGDDDATEAELDETPGDEDALDGDDGDGSEDVPAGDEAESESGEAPDEVAPRQRRTASDVVRDAKKARQAAEQAARERETEAAALRAELAAERRRAEAAENRQNAERARETAEQEAARIELMSPDEKISYYRDKDRNEHRNEITGLQRQIWESTDRAAFRDLCRENPLVAKVKDAVEKRFNELAAQGRPVSREVLADLELGRSLREKGPQAAQRQRERAAAGVRRETVRPPRNRSDVAPDRQRRAAVDEKAARAARLADVTL